jgi:hypothetical protein
MIHFTFLLKISVVGDDISFATFFVGDISFATLFVGDIVKVAILVGGMAISPFYIDPIPAYSFWRCKFQI